MNTNALFDPTIHMLRTLMESSDAGLFRIEISYYASSILAERELLKPITAELMH